MEKRYSFHIAFSDGSNPYYHFGTTYSKHYSALQQWKKNYSMVEVNRIKTKIGYTAFYEAATLSDGWKRRHTQ